LYKLMISFTRPISEVDHKVKEDMYSVLNCHNVAKHAEFCLGYLQFNVTSIRDSGCFKNGFIVVFQLLLCGECYENTGASVFVTLATD
jgi:hypothetical protein